MRRYISYIIMCAAMLLGVGASAVPMIKATNPDLAYADGKTLYFKASHYTADDPSANGSYSEFLDSTDVNNGTPVIEELADEVSARLTNWDMSEFEVKTQGYDTIAVTLRSPNNDLTQYTYLQQYLAFSGGDYELDATDTSYDDYSHPDVLNDIIDGQTAVIQDIDMGSYKVPVVVVPLKDGDEYREAFKNLVTYCDNHTSAAETDENGNETAAAVNTNIVVWANRETDDTYDKTTSDINVRARVLTVQGAANDNAVWYDSADTEKETPYLQLIPASDAISGESYDPTKTKEAYNAAKFLVNMFNAKSYHAFDSSDQSRTYHLNFTYMRDASATVEQIITLGDWSMDVTFGKTLLATVITIVVLSVVLGLIERIFALTHVSCALASVAATFALFIAFGAQFNIAAIIGLIVPAAVSLFGSLYYSRTLKNEIYKGRTLKKANQEAAKKSLVPTVDAGVVSIILGVFVYLFAGDIASKAGIMLVVGGFFAALISVIFTRIGGWLLCNDNTMQTIYPKQLGIDTSKIPDALKEEKQSFFGAYADRDFSKGKLWTSIVSGLFVLAGVVTMVVFGVKDGTVYNVSEYTSPSTVLRLDVRSEDSSAIDIESVSGINNLIGNDINDNPNLLAGFKVKLSEKSTKSLDQLTNSELITLSETPKTEYISDDAGGTTYYWFYYEIQLTKYLDPDATYTVSTYSDSGWTDQENVYLDDALNTYISTQFIYETDEFYFAVAKTTPEVSEPSLGKLSLGLGIGIAVAALYLVLRYRPSRGLAAGIAALVASYSSVAFFVFTRISVMPTVAIGSTIVALIAFLFALFALAGEKETIRESHEKDKSGVEFRGECLRLATSRNAGITLILAALALWIAVLFFAFSTSAYSMSYLNIVIGLAMALAFALCLLPFLAEKFALLFSKIKFKPSTKKKKKQTGQLLKKNRSGEPEEAIFIGIND
ncbi:MAG: hypothetical protein K6F32_07185 [Bacilli bacterium]|nr:hypothetical protein [Bacilli bacterium]